MNSHPLLKIDYCSYEASKFSVERWHYSKVMPAGKRNQLGVWEEGQFIGTVVFSTGAGPQSHRPFGIKRTEICELTRVALADGHRTTVSRIVSISLKILRRRSPGLRMAISYADPLQGHHGGVYQAGNWVYLGISKCTHFVSPSGRQLHSKTLANKRRGYATTLQKAGVIKAKRFFKHKYAMPFDKEMKTKLGSSLPYPKRENEKR